MISDVAVCDTVFGIIYFSERGQITDDVVWPVRISVSNTHNKTTIMDDGTFSASATTTTTSFGPLFLVTGSPGVVANPVQPFVPSSVPHFSLLLSVG